MWINQKICGFFETWSNDSNDNNLWTLDSKNFVAFRWDRSAVANKKRKCWAVMILIPKYFILKYAQI